MPLLALQYMSCVRSCDASFVAVIHLRGSIAVQEHIQKNNIYIPPFCRPESSYPNPLLFNDRVSAALDRDVRELPDHREGLIVSLAEWCVARPVDDNSVDTSRRCSYGF